MKTFFEKMGSFMRNHCPAVHRQYDVKTTVWRNERDEEPLFTHARAGEFRVNLWQGAVIVLACLTLLASQRRR